MNWLKKGLIIEPRKDLWWMQSHAMLPTVEHISGNLYKIYFSGRDSENRSQIGYSLAEVKDGIIRIIEYSANPVLTVGERGCFDDNGVTPSWVVKTGEETYLYYIGWNSGTSTIRMSLIAGLAVYNNELNRFERFSRAPLLERTNSEPFTIMTAPCVINEGNIWKMWYVSCEGWIDKDLPKYNIKYAESSDGIHWKREGHICIDFRSDKETALARPCVISEVGLYKMFYSYKDPEIGYRIGYAESLDGKNWSRMDDKSGIEISETGWDSEMIEYSYVFDHDAIKYLLYNGNNYGYGGIGYAVIK